LSLKLQGTNGIKCRKLLQAGIKPKLNPYPFHLRQHYIALIIY